MREILFRGKSLANGKWVYGYYVFQPQLSEFVGQTGTMRDRDRYYIITLNDGAFEVDPETVGQFTGLYDNNGKKVFEGDILKYKDKNGSFHAQPGIIFYGESNCSCCHGVYGFASLKASECIRYLDESPRTDEAGYEVVGNIHDNPDMI